MKRVFYNLRARGARVDPGGVNIVAADFVDHPIAK